MPINRYQIRNVYSLAHPELYKASGKDDPEALLEGVAMAGLVGVLRQLGDLAEFAAEIFHDLHEEVMSTAARGHGLLVRVQQLESEIPPIERAFLSQTSHSAFFLNSGVDWHPKGRTTQNLITTGDLPRFVMDSYEECRGPPRLFLLDKFDVGGAGACLKRYTDPSIFKVEESSDEIEIAETLREKKMHQTKKNASKCKGGETPEVSPSTHAKLHQLFLEEPMQTDETEAACHVKLKKLPKKSPFGSENYMNKLLDSPSCAHEVVHTPSNESRFEDSSIMGSPMKNTSPCVSSSKAAESQPSYDNEITVNDENNSTTKVITVSGNPDTANTSTENEACSDHIDSSTPMILVPNILEATKNQTGYDLEIHSTDSVVSSSQSVISDQAEGETKSDNLETESVTVADANKNERFEDSVLKDKTGTESEEKETESTYSDVKKDDDKSADDIDENKVDQVKHQSSPVLSDFTILPKLPPGKVEDPPPLPPLPPMQWRMRNLQKYWSTRMNYSQHSDNHQEVVFSGTHTENQNPHTQHNEVFWPSSSPYSLPLVLDDKNKLRKVSDRDTTQILKGEERETLLDQIRAKSVNLKPAVQTRPNVQGPTTNLRVVAILEKANAIRQAFAGSDDDESDNWSDS